MRRLMTTVLMGFVLLTTNAVYATDIDDFLAGPPYPGGLPRCIELLTISDSDHDACQVELGAFENEVTECQGVIDDLNDTIAGLQTQIDNCAGITWPGDGDSGPAHSCTDTGNTVLCNNGLEWTKKNTTAGSPLHRDVKLSYADAQQWVADLNSSAYEGGGWRLPRREEALSIMQFMPGAPVVDSMFGAVTLSAATYYWTTTPDVVDPSARWLMDFWVGLATRTATPSNALYRVIAVR